MFKTRSCVHQTQPGRSDHQQTAEPCSRRSIACSRQQTTKEPVAAVDHGGAGRRRAAPSEWNWWAGCFGSALASVGCDGLAHEPSADL